MSDVSKMVADKLVFAEAVAAAIEVQGARVVEGVLGGGLAAMPRTVLLAAFVEWTGGVLRSASETLHGADVALSAEGGDDAAPRAARDAATAALRAQLLRATGLVSGAYGTAFSASVGLESPLVTRGDMLVTQATDIVRRLRAAAAPAELTPGVRPDLAAIADAIDTLRGTLATSLADVKREERELQAALVTRDRAEDTWGRVYIGVAEIFSGLCMLAGEVELAARVRPTARRRSGLPDEEPVTPAPTPES